MGFGGWLVTHLKSNISSVMSSLLLQSFDTCLRLSQNVSYIIKVDVQLSFSSFWFLSACMCVWHASYKMYVILSELWLYYDTTPFQSLCGCFLSLSVWDEICIVFITTKAMTFLFTRDQRSLTLVFSVWHPWVVSDETQVQYCDPQVSCYERLDLCSDADCLWLLRCRAGIHIFQMDSAEWKEVIETVGSGMQWLPLRSGTDGFRGSSIACQNIPCTVFPVYKQ